MTETQDGERLWHGDGDEHTEPECLNPDHFEDPPIPPRPDPELDRIATPTPDDRDREALRLLDELLDSLNPNDYQRIREARERLAAPDDRNREVERIAQTLYDVGYGTRGNLNGPERMTIARGLYDAGLRASGGRT